MRKPTESVIREGWRKVVWAPAHAIGSVEILLPPEALRLPAAQMDGPSAPWAIGEAPPETPYESRPGRTLKPRRKRRIRVVRPGQPGTKRLAAQYGDRLLCVRYIYDAETGRRLKTAELLVEEAPWTPQRARIAPEQLVGLRVAYEETGLREAVRRAGGRWDRVLQVWVLPYRKAQELHLQGRLTHSAPPDRARTASKERTAPHERTVQQKSYNSRGKEDQN